MCCKVIRGCPWLQENTSWVISLLFGFKICLGVWGNPTPGLRASPPTQGPVPSPTRAWQEAAVGARPDLRSPHGARGDEWRRGPPPQARTGLSPLPRRGRVPAGGGKRRGQAATERPRSTSGQRYIPGILARQGSPGLAAPEGGRGTDAGAGSPRFPVGGTGRNRSEGRGARGTSGCEGVHDPAAGSGRTPHLGPPGRGPGAAEVRPAHGVRVPASRGGAQRPTVSEGVAVGGFLPLRVAASQRAGAGGAWRGGARVAEGPPASSAALCSLAASAEFAPGAGNRDLVQALPGAQVRLCVLFGVLLRSLLTARAASKGEVSVARASKWDRVRTRISPGLSSPHLASAPGWASRPYNFLNFWK